MGREPTTSVTHLVKQVAREEFEKLLDERDHPTLRGVAEKFLERIESDVAEAGAPWPKEEEDILRSELDVAFATMAKNHHRTVGAIKSRLKCLGIIFSTQL